MSSLCASMHIIKLDGQADFVMMLAVASYDAPEFREQHAADQRRMIGQMCRETGLTMSALAAEAGVHNSTITRYTRLGRPNKWDTFIKMVRAYARIMKDLGKQPAPNILRYVQNLGLGDLNVGGAVEVITSAGEGGDPPALTAARLRVAIAMANEEFETGLSDEDVSDIADYVNALYPIIVSAEASTGRPADPHDTVLRARIRRERVRRESSGGADR